MIRNLNYDRESFTLVRDLRIRPSPNDSYELQLPKQTPNLKSGRKIESERPSNGPKRITGDLVKKSIRWSKVNPVNSDPSRSTLDQIEIELNHPVFLNRFQRYLRSRRNKSEFDTISGEELRREDGFCLIQLGRSSNWTGPARPYPAVDPARPFTELDWSNSANGRAESRGRSSSAVCRTGGRSSSAVCRTGLVQLGERPS
ncbi:hypothetical protein F2Q70_00039307 [Brassica cretica]|uniref:Uncharacterized protein n=1 Tax=Brassica cretica TaxID=69181 RepID=A0A8S9K2W5_BRACR|nr:hypothetical protein F2Q70_00039307 [Brassica cretica]